jgi:formylglycine-generating enzyme
MVRVPAPDRTTYCIDSTEVTNAQYLRFLAAKGSDTSGQDEWCSWNSTYTPVSGWPAVGKAGDPVVSVNWCDAYAYCKWAGKRLCGKIGGGPNSYADYTDATKSEWFNACSAGGTQRYPYGSTYDGAACVGADYDGTTGYQSGSDLAHPVGGATGCHGTISPFDSIHDFSGNVWEWEDSCSGTTGTNDQCRLRGGSFVSVVTYLACGYDYYGSREDAYEVIGFRCCGE